MMRRTGSWPHTEHRKALWVLLPFFFAVAQSAFAQSPDDLASAARSGICPANLSTYSRIDGNDECNPGGREIRACDSNHKAASRSWQACYQEVSDCRKKIDAENDKIREYNSLIYKCRTAAARNGSASLPTKRPPPASGGIDLDAALNASKQAAEKSDVQLENKKNEFDEALQSQFDAAKARADGEARRQRELAARQEELYWANQQEQVRQRTALVRQQLERERRAEEQRARERRQNQQTDMFLRGLVEGLDAVISSPPPAAGGSGGSGWNGGSRRRCDPGPGACAIK